MKRFSVPLAVASLAALTLAACQNEPPMRGGMTLPPSTTAPQTPAGTPAVAPSSLPVSPVGPLSQAGIDKYMDGQERELRLRLRGRGVGVLRKGEDIVLVIANDKLFTGTSVSSAGQALLAGVAQTLQRYNHSQIAVNGYTDTAGTPQQNLDVTQKRAALVAEALVGDGIAAARLEAHGFGATNLKVMTGDHVAQSRNRRIELRISARPGN
jgi:outer membrane protein OmpA-like peptidoglycan-associated protein